MEFHFTGAVTLLQVATIAVALIVGGVMWLLTQRALSRFDRQAVDGRFRSRTTWVLRYLVAALVVGSCAFALVREAAVEDYCERCNSYRFSYRFYVAGIPCASQTRLSESDVSKMAEDLGCRCEHNWSRRRNRASIFARLVHEDVGARDWIFRDDWYTPQLREQVRRMGRENPKLGREFETSVLRDSDLTLFRKIVAQLEQPGELAADTTKSP